MLDLTIAKKYIEKHNNANKAGVKFDLNLMSFMNIMRSKKCYYTGIPLTNKTITVDRIDNSKGYVAGNVVACSNMFNQIKGYIENPKNAVTKENLMMGIKKC